MTKRIQLTTYRCEMERAIADDSTNDNSSDPLSNTTSPPWRHQQQQTLRLLLMERLRFRNHSNNFVNSNINSNIINDKIIINNTSSFYVGRTRQQQQ